MEKYIYDNSNGLWYELHGNYYLPCLSIPEEEVHTIGIYGRKLLDYIKEHSPVLYADLVLSCKLYGYLADIDTQTRNRITLLTKQMAEKEGVTEELKARDQMEWIGRMNNIRQRAQEIVRNEILEN